MLDTRPFVMRALIAKGGGAVLGLLAFLLIPVFTDQLDLYYRLGVALWLVALGGIVAVMGLFDHHPLWSSMRLPWWVRGPATGLWMAAMLVLLAREDTTVLVRSIGLDAFRSPWWLLADGLFWGAVLDYAATKWAGEGAALVKRA